MTEISEAAKAKAMEAFRAEGCQHLDGYIRGMHGFVALARFIQQVSDAAKEAAKLMQPPHGPWGPQAVEFLAPFILPEPVEPLLIEARKVVAEVFRENGYVGCPFEKGGYDEHPEMKVALAALKRGLKIVEAA